MAWVTRTRDGMKLKPYLTDLNCFRVVKTRQQVTCCDCKKRIPKGSWVYGSDWTRLCLDCGEKFSFEATKGFEDVIRYIKNSQKLLKMNKDKLATENSVALL